MPKRRIIHHPGACHFVTFSTYQRRRFLEPDRAKEIVLETLQEYLISYRGKCSGFVVMPNHVHVILFGDDGYDLPRFLQFWKKTSSYRIGQFYREYMETYREFCPNNCPIWQPRYYDFNIESEAKHNEKLDYIHANPVVAELCESGLDWHWSSARFYELNEGVGVTISYE